MLTRIKIVFWESEDGNANVGKDEIFRHEIQETEKLLGY
jgi:hypothetical protein